MREMTETYIKNILPGHITTHGEYTTLQIKNSLYGIRGTATELIEMIYETINERLPA